MIKNTTLDPLDLVLLDYGSSNKTINLELDNIFFQPELILISLYLPTIVISLVANVVLIVIAIKSNYIKNVTNIFLVNLSTADLLVTFVCMPIQLSKAFTLIWYYGETVCKLVNYMQGVAVAASVFTLSTMSVDRWLSISPEPRLRPTTRKQALLLLLMLWSTALLIFLPLLSVSVVHTEHLPTRISRTIGNSSVVQTKEYNFCTEEWSTPESRSQFGIFSFSIVYAIPGTITILAYVLMGRTLCFVRPPFDIDEGIVSMQQGQRLIKERKRVAWLLLLLAVLFALCWLPYNIMLLLLDIELVETKSLSFALPYALYLGHANSAINPIVYCLMTRNIQRSAKKFLCGKGVCRRATTMCYPQKPDRSSSDYDLYHEPHKKCYLQMHHLRGSHTTQVNAPAQSCRGIVLRARTSQLSHVARPCLCTAPAHTLSQHVMMRHGVVDSRH